MPRRDGSGPMGYGAMTGRGLGACTGVNARVYGAGYGTGIGLGCRRGIGRSIGGFFQVDPYNGKTQTENLVAQQNILKSRLEEIDRQLKTMQE